VFALKILGKTGNKFNVTCVSTLLCNENIMNGCISV